VVSKVGTRVDHPGIESRLRVAFFPAPGSWRDEVIVPAGSVMPLPDYSSVLTSDASPPGAQLLINTATALIAIRTNFETNTMLRLRRAACS
jgi:NADPH:quinone reductase-like Zn-dependent oxidoreductase